jgi:hypothetical protein
MNLYIKERYPQFEDSNKTAFEYLTYLKKNNFQFLNEKEGFIVYKFEGDACIINDIYICNEYRKTKSAWKLFNNLRNLTLTNKNCKVLIGFSEHNGNNHQSGIGAMTAAGFVKTGQDDIKDIYIRGNW